MAEHKQPNTKSSKRRSASAQARTKNSLKDQTFRQGSKGHDSFLSRTSLSLAESIKTGKSNADTSRDHNQRKRKRKKYHKGESEKSFPNTKIATSVQSESSIGRFLKNEGKDALKGSSHGPQPPQIEIWDFEEDWSLTSQPKRKQTSQSEQKRTSHTDQGEVSSGTFLQQKSKGGPSKASSHRDLNSQDEQKPASLEGQTGDLNTEVSKGSSERGQKSHVDQSQKSSGKAPKATGRRIQKGDQISE
ncbi:hypothetical protein MMC10_010849 [Thelotrema lepadinum]|nr:hypothetical protein [Thelotrema lepadinum]